VRIAEVAGLTGLTKKAIRYYEAAGLISPASNPDNSYREYSTEDLLRLEEIAVLRALGLSVAEIREALVLRREPFAPVLRRHAARLREEAARLGDTALVIEQALSGLGEGLERGTGGEAGYFAE
jgi:DNA-binding transcriptional MerR regulator